MKYLFLLISKFFSPKITSPQETIIISKKSHSGSTIQQQIVYTAANPHIKSRAALVLLQNELMFQDVDYLEDELSVWLEFRERYLNKILKEKGDLVCTYCGKPHLEIGGRTPKDLELNNKNPNLATIDHIEALANGGAKYNEENLCVSCKKCNRDKGTKPVETFKPKIKVETF